MDTPDDRPAPAAAGWALAALSLAMILSSLGTSIANVALPTLAQVFGVTFQHVQWVVLAYLLAVTTLVVSVGRLGDLIGRKRLLLAGLALFTAASLLCGLSPGFWLLIAARALQGVGGAVMMALTLAFVGEIVAAERAGSAMGLLGTMSSVGTATGPFLGGALIAATSWRSLFLLNVPLGLAALFLAHRYLPADRAGPRAAAGFDKTGTVLLGLSLAAYAIAMTTGRGHFGLVNAGLLVVAAIGVAVFLRVEKRAPFPLVDPALFGDRALSTGLGLSILVSSVAMASLVVGPFYLALGLEMSPASIGLVLAVGPIVAAFSGVPAGRLVDRFKPRAVMVGGLCVMGAGSAALAVTPPSFGVGGYLAAMVVLTIGYAFFQASNNTGVMAGIPRDRRGAVSGMLNLARNLGLVTGASLMGAIFLLATGATELSSAGTAAISTGFHVTFGLSAVLIAVAVLLARRAGRPTTPG